MSKTNIILISNQIANIQLVYDIMFSVYAQNVHDVLIFIYFMGKFKITKFYTLKVDNNVLYVTMKSTL